MPETNSSLELFGEPVSVYTRAQAIEDGELVDVTSLARECGFVFPVAVTRAVWDKYITPDERSRRLGQSEQGRLWDTLWMLRAAIQRAPEGGGQVLEFRLFYVMQERRRRPVTLKSICGPGDDGRPVMTIMLPEED